MPFTLVAAFADLMWAVMAVALAIAVVIFFRAIADGLPDIPVVTPAIRTFINYWTGHVASWVISNTKQYFVRIVALIRSHPWMFLNSIVDIVRVLTHHGDQIAHLNNTTIPGAAQTAEDHARGYTDNQVHPVADSLASAITDEHRDVVSLQNNINDLRTYVDGPFNADLRSAINAGITGDQQALTTAITTIDDEITQGFAAVNNDIVALNQLATVTIPSEIATAEANAIAAAHADTVSQVQAIESQIASIQDQIATNAGVEATALANVKAGIDIEINQGLAAEAATQTIALNGAIDQLKTQLDTITSQIAIDDANIGVLQNVTGFTIPASITAIATAVGVITSEIDTCMVSTCEGPNNWQNLLNSLTTGLTFAELVSFLQAVVHDPGGEAAAVASTAQGLFNDGHAMLEGLLSL